MWLKFELLLCLLLFILLGTSTVQATTTNGQLADEHSGKNSCVKLSRLNPFRKSPEIAEKEEEKLYKELAAVVKGEKGLDESQICSVSFADVNLLNLLKMLELGKKLVGVVSLNYERNLVDVDEKEELRDEKEMKKLEEEVAGGGGICPFEEEQGGDEDKPTEEIVPVQLDHPKEIGREKGKQQMEEITLEQEINIVLVQPVTGLMTELAQNVVKEVDEKRWKAEKRPKVNWKNVFKLSLLKDWNKKWEAKKWVKSIKVDLKERDRTKWTFHEWKQFKQNWRKKWWTAIPKWLGYYMNPWHCIGLNDLVKGIGRLFQGKKKKEERRYEQHGRQLFEFLCYMNGISAQQMEDSALDVNSLLTKKEGERERDLDEIIGTLNKFTASALLMPFKKRPMPKEEGDQGQNEADPRNGEWELKNDEFEELNRLRALLTSQKLLEAIVQRIKDTAPSQTWQPSGEGTSELRHPFPDRRRRRKRVIVEGGMHMAFGGISFSAPTLAIGISSIVGFILLLLAVPWCMGWFNMPW